MAGTLLGGCWLLPEEPTPPRSTLSPIDDLSLDCSSECTQPVCASNGFIFCNACDAADAGYSIVEMGLCTISPPTPSSSSYASSSSSQAIVSAAELIEFWEYYTRIQAVLGDSPAVAPKLIFDTEGCSCFSNYDPVCSVDSRITYMNDCLASCSYDSGDLKEGTCLEAFSMPEGSTLGGFSPLIEPMLQQMTGEEFMEMQRVINSVSLPEAIQALPPEEASALALQLALGQMMLDSAGASLISKYLAK